MKSILILTTFLINSIAFAHEFDSNPHKEAALNNSGVAKMFVVERNGKRLYIDEGRQVFVKVDPSKYFEVEIDGYKRAIYQGKKVTVKIDSRKYKGVFGIINDSTISVDNHQFSLSEIDMISTPRTGKTIGLIFASLPIHFTGLVLTAFGISEGIIGIAIGGIATIGVGVTGVILEAKRGKRYHAYSLGFNKGTINRKWNYSIQQ